MQYGPQRERVALTFEIPAICAEVVERNEAQIGLAPVAEVARQALEVVPGHGIACHGAVRSILLVSRTPIRNIRTLATDLSSRTSVQLARIVLRELYCVQPEFRARPPVLETMLAECDAALAGDMGTFERWVSRLAKVPLAQHEFDALVSWSFNTGGPESATLWKKLNAGNKAAVPAELAKWNRGGGKVLAGLVRRRKAEGLLFAGDVKGALAVAHS